MECWSNGVLEVWVLRITPAPHRARHALPPKLTVPMILFFLPVLFAVILTPAMIQIFKWK